MTRRKVNFVKYEWYHCYNRSIEGRTAFEDEQDYQRFLELLYVANDDSPLRYGDIGQRDKDHVFTLSRGRPLVSIGAFCLMQTNFHLALKEVAEGGITAFMRKLGTAYTMYFNARRSRRGNLFLKPFQSLAVLTERDLRHAVSFIHSSPAALYEREWGSGTIVDPQFLEDHLVAYRYSSLGSHLGKQKPSTAVLDRENFSLTRAPSVHTMLQEARQYYRTHAFLP